MSNDCAIFYNTDCENHLIPNHPEQPKRVISILSSLHSNWTEKFFLEASEVTDEVICYFHTPTLVENFQEISTRAKQLKSIERIDGDTKVCRYTKRAAYLAAGSMINALDRMYLNENDPQRLR